MNDTQSIMTAASLLSEEERVSVVEALLQTLTPATAESPEDLTEAWCQEVRRRSDELHRGQVSSIPWSEVRAEGERLLDDRA